jgi:SRSO17 transposase
LERLFSFEPALAQSRTVWNFMITATPSRTSAESLADLEDYLAAFRDLFTRSDQAKAFGLYVRGLLDGEHRKNVESIAGRVAGQDAAVSNLAQSLQHFVTQSPWDAERVVARYRELLPRPGGPRVWVVHDGAIPKKGRSSVGVFRQFARSLGRKVNCQVAVMVTDVTIACLPLAGRLYLPGQWLRDNQPQAGRTVPDRHREPRSKAEVALDLVEELLTEGRPDRLIAEDGYISGPTFREGLGRWGIPVSEGEPHVDAALRVAREGFESLKEGLGLSHFEGRTWVGWHHHLALVLAAFGYRVRGGPALDSLPSLPVN